MNHESHNPNVVNTSLLLEESPGGETSGVLDLASRAGMLALRDVFSRLQSTNFRYPPSLMEALLEEERKRKGWRI